MLCFQLQSKKASNILWPKEMWNSCTSQHDSKRVLINTCACEQQQLNNKGNRGRMYENKSEKEKNIYSIFIFFTKRSRRPNNSSGLPSPWSRYSPKLWMNFITNLTYNYNPFTTPWEGHNVLKTKYFFLETLSIFLGLC